MILRKTLLVASAVALISTPAWALADQNPSYLGAEHAPSTTPVGPPSTTPNNTNNPGASNRSQHDNHGSGKDNHGQSNDSGKPGEPEHPSHPQHPSHPEHPGHPQYPGHPKHPSHPGKSHKCMPRTVTYVVSGTLVSQTLSKNPDGTYSGDVTINVTRTNRHAADDEGMTKTYTLTDARVKLDLADVNHDGSVGLDDLVAGDRVKVIASITTLSKKCDQSSFTAQMTIRKVIFHAPVTRGS
jgi:hypothetical protein